LARICVTGGIACGKSLVGAFLAGRGVAICDTDILYHEMMQAGRPLFKRVVAAFGQGIVGAGGEIDRGVLGRMVFADGKKLNRLNRLVHPALIRAVTEWLRERAVGLRRRRIVAVLVPLVYEVGWERAWDHIVCVGAPARIQVERLRRRGLSAAAARARIAAQWPLQEKMRRADYVVFNGGSRRCARRQTVRILENITQHGETRHGRYAKKRW
jgi:dephospho-CoA kinase